MLKRVSVELWFVWSPKSITNYDRQCGANYDRQCGANYELR